MFLFNAVIGRVWGGGNGDEENEMKGFMIAKLLLFFRCFVELENGGAKGGEGKGERMGLDLCIVRYMGTFVR